MIDHEMGRWRDWLIAQFYIAMHNREADNFDTWRFRGENPDAFNLPSHCNYLSLIFEHFREFYEVRCLLGDEESKDLFDKLVLYRLLGHLHVRLPYDTLAAKEHERVANSWKVADTKEDSRYGALSVFDVPMKTRTIRMQGWSGNAVASFIESQYYLYRQGIHAKQGDRVIDGGGCFGDTALRFAHEVGPDGAVFTFDPIQKHCEIMREAFAMNPELELRIKIYRFGLSDVNMDGTSVGGGIDPGARATDDLPLRTIDSLDLGRIDFIKMDIEGSELAALKGGEQTIRTHRPQLAISLYHRPVDFFTIPLWLNGLGCAYRMYLDHYSMHAEETVLYAAV